MARTTSGFRFPVTALFCPGVVSNFATTSDFAAADITSDIDLRVLCALTKWTGNVTAALNQVMLAKWTALGNQRSYQFYLNNTGGLALTLTTDGSTQVTATSSVAVTSVVSNGAPLYVRATWRQSDGRVQFFTSTDLAVTWVQLGTDQTIAIASILSGTGSVNVGAFNTGLTNPCSGVIYLATIMNGIAGALVYAPLFYAAQPGTTSFTEPLGNTVTINTSGSPPAQIRGRTAAGARTTAGARTAA